jgi:hypothetical protein
MTTNTKYIHRPHSKASHWNEDSELTDRLDLKSCNKCIIIRNTLCHTTNSLAYSKTGVFWNMSPRRCLWVEFPRSFEVTWRTAQFAATADNCLTLRMQVTRSVETWVTSYPKTQQHRWENLRSGINFLLSKKYYYIYQNTKIYPYNKYMYIHQLTYRHWDVSIELISVWVFKQYVHVLSFLTQCELNYCQAGQNRA